MRKTKYGSFALGFIAGVVVTVGGLLWLLYAYAPSEDQFQMSSAAYKDHAACPILNPGTLVGEWKGVKEFERSGITQTWTNIRRSDGTFRIEFISENGLKNENSSEEGYWAYSGCLYSTIVRKKDDAEVLYQDVYRVHEITPNYIRYTSFRTGNEFEMQKVSSE